MKPTLISVQKNAKRDGRLFATVIETGETADVAPGSPEGIQVALISPAKPYQDEDGDTQPGAPKAHIIAGEAGVRLLEKLLAV